MFILEKGKIFNLLDTNGRRHDILNAFDIYLSFLEGWATDYPQFDWKTIPASPMEAAFYINAYRESEGVFKNHAFYLRHRQAIDAAVSDLKCGGSIKTHRIFADPAFAQQFQRDIEGRARHYSSSLVKLGLVTGDRKLTKPGRDYFDTGLLADGIEDMLGLTNRNLVILRQLLKLRIYSKKGSDGCYAYYSPFALAVYLLLRNPNSHIPSKDFSACIQIFSPYNDPATLDSDIDAMLSGKYDALTEGLSIPDTISQENQLSAAEFSKYFSSSKSKSRYIPIYFAFYQKIWNLCSFRNDAALNDLKDFVSVKENLRAVNSAFGRSGDVFPDFQEYQRYGIETFLGHYEGHSLLTSTADLNRSFYLVFCQSKAINQMRENADTTRRMLSATGLFSFAKAFPELKNPRFLSFIFSASEWRKRILGRCTESEADAYERDVFCGRVTLIGALNLTEEEARSRVEALARSRNLSVHDLRADIAHETGNAFSDLIRQRYSKETVIKLLAYFEDREKYADKIKSLVPGDATLPTIYEYVVGLAWYYLTEGTVDLYSSLKLTMNADFEPLTNAPGGTGDIVSRMPDGSAVMIEVTLMEASQQGRGELEPVLRHATEITDKYSGSDVLTLFFSPSLYMNNAADWFSTYRNVRRASNNNLVRRLKIIAFTNKELIEFLNAGVTSRELQSKIDAYFRSGVTTESEGWRDDLVKTILDRVHGKH